MKKLFAPDSPFAQFVTNAGTLVWINLLWLLCCIPVITVGASTAAMYRMVFNLREDKSCKTADFFRAFASNLKQATLIWLLMPVVAFCLYLLYSAIGFYSARVLQLAVLAAFLCFLLIAMAVALYAFPLTCYFENTLSGTLSNALTLALSRPLRTLGAMALSLLPVAVFLFFRQAFLTLLVVFVLIVPAVLSYAIAVILRPVFEPFIPEEDVPQTEED